MTGENASQASRRDARTLLDTAIAVVAAITITWVVVARPLVDVAQGWFHRVVLFAYPVGDLVMFAVLVPLLLNLRRRPDATVLRLLGTSQLFYIAGDLAYQLVSTDTSLALAVIVDFLLLAGYLGLICAAEAAARQPLTTLVSPEEPGTASQSANPLPILLGLVVYGMLLYEVSDAPGISLRVLAVATIAVTILILGRESLTERLNLRLASDLASARSEARVRSVVAQLPTGVMVIEAEGRVAVSNPAARELLERSDEELARGLNGVRPWDVVHDDGTPAPDPLHSAREALAQRRPVRGVMIGVAREDTGDRRWLLVDAEPKVSDTGDVHEVVCTFQDVTERRALEEHVRQTQRMEAVGKLAGGVAHDFNNLLTAINGYAAILLSGLLPHDRRADDVREIIKAADKAAVLTQQLLAYGRRQARQPERLDLNEVVRDTSLLLRNLMGPQIDCRFELAGDTGVVLVDRGQLEQVLVNLVVNSRDAMPDGGTLTVSTLRVTADSPRLPAGFELPLMGGILISVSDTGRGMTDAVRARAFDPFFTTKGVGQGSGLGLASVHGIVQQSRGEIWIDSEMGSGTTVHVVLPAQPGGVAHPTGPRLEP
ncbi:MAG: PAS domain-containing protein [Cytophagaceae bacterium]|nr:PAS domain-containing protein [Gemmatimonadaceae bacterium]